MSLRSWPRHLRMLVLLFVIAAVGVSCSDALGPEMEPGDPALLLAPSGGVILEVTPAGPLDLTVGDTVTLRSPASTDINFLSSDTAIINVSARGLVTARAPGDARVLLTSKRSPRAFGSVVVRVQTRGVSSLTLRNLDSSAGTPRDPQNLSGRFTPSFNVTRGDASRLEVLINSVTVCSRELEPRPIAADSIPEVVECGVDTGVVGANGAPLLYNGPADIVAKLFRGDGRILASAGVAQGRLNNPATLLSTLTSRHHATDPGGKVWVAGDLSVTSVPVSYVQGETFESVTVELRTDGRVWRQVALAPSFTARFSAAELGAGVLPELRVVATSRAVSGKEVAYTSAVLGYDPVPPAGGTVRPVEWVGTEFAFASIFSPGVTEDGGVGGVHVRFFAARGGADENELFADENEVQRGADVRGSLDRYDLGFAVCDALQNCVRTRSFSFRLDVDAPVISNVSLPLRSINPELLSLRASDERSGLGESPFEVVVQAVLEGSTAPLCGPVIEVGLDLPGTETAGVCRPTPTGPIIPIPTTSSGYYFYRIVAVDRAGNRSAPLERAILVDRVRPGVSSFTIDSGLLPGEEASLTAQVVDNLDLSTVGFSLSYPRAGASRLTLPFTSVPVGTPYSGKLTRSARVSAKLQVVRSLTTGTRGSSDRSTVLADSLFAEVTDAAQMRTTAGRAVTSSTISPNTPPADPFPAVMGATVNAPTRICTSGCPASETTSTATIRVTGEPGFNAMNRAYLFARSATGRVTLLGSRTNFDVSESGSQRTYTYTLTFTPPAGLAGPYTVFGVAVSAAGNGLKSNDVETEFFTR